jgi:hypothetical protein
LQGRRLVADADWPALRELTGDSPYAKAFFTLAKELGLSS